LEAYGVRPQVIPDHPKMGPLVMALMRRLQNPVAANSGIPISSRTTKPART
jgi:hypothetical protein